MVCFHGGKTTDGRLITAAIDHSPQYSFMDVYFSFSEHQICSHSFLSEIPFMFSSVLPRMFLYHHRMWRWELPSTAFNRRCPVLTLV